MRLAFSRPVGIDDAKMVIAFEAVVNIDGDAVVNLHRNSGVDPCQLSRPPVRRRPSWIAIHLGVIGFHLGRARAATRSKRSGSNSSRGARPAEMQQIPDALHAKLW